VRAFVRPPNFGGYLFAIREITAYKILEVGSTKRFAPPRPAGPTAFLTGDFSRKAARACMFYGREDHA
jgi:hypothetical protein